MASAVVDTSALIFLARLDRVRLLERFTKTSLPRAVWEEIVAGETKDPASAQVVREAIKAGTLRLIDVEVPPTFLPHLGKGERVAILAASTEESTLLVDDRKARQAANVLRIQTLGIPALLLTAVREGALGYPEFESDMYRLVELGYFLSPKLFNDFLAAARESAR